jgi:hypothetical protein
MRQKIKHTFNKLQKFSLVDTLSDLGTTLLANHMRIDSKFTYTLNNRWIITKIMP